MSKVWCKVKIRSRFIIGFSYIISTAYFEHNLRACGDDVLEVINWEINQRLTAGWVTVVGN